MSRNIVIIEVNDPAEQFPEEDFDTVQEFMKAVSSFLASKFDLNQVPEILIFDKYNQLFSNFDICEPNTIKLSFSKMDLNITKIQQLNFHIYANFMAAHENQGKISYFTTGTDISPKKNMAEKVKFDQLI